MTSTQTPLSERVVNEALAIKPVAHKTFDCFWSKGWEGWSRFEKKYFNGKLHLNLIKGNPMPKDLFRQLYESLVK